MNSSADLRDALESLPDESTYPFELKVTSLVTRRPPREVEPELREILQIETNPKVKYAAFYGLSIVLRREKSYRELLDVTSRYAPEFSDQKTLPHLRSLALEDEPASVDESLRCATLAKEGLPDHPGVLNRFATAVFDAESRHDVPDEKSLGDAVRAIDRAIVLTGGEYAKHFATLARIQALRGDYSSALASIAAAIAREDKDVADFALRIGEYQITRLDIIFRERFAALRREQEDTEQRLQGIEKSASETIREMRTESVQFLGVLTAVIAFVVTGSQAALTSSTFVEGGRVFLLVASAILVILGTFGIVTYAGGTRIIRSASVIALGVLGGLLATRGWEWLISG